MSEATKSGEAMRWRTEACERGAFAADDVVAWVNANGGEARYEPDTFAQCFGRCYGVDHSARIAVRTADGWAYAAPGDTIRPTDEWFSYEGRGAYDHTYRAFEVSS